MLWICYLKDIVLLLAIYLIYLFYILLAIYLIYIRVFYFSVNYVKYIFSTKIKKTEIVIYVHENMIWTSFQIIYHNLLRNKVTRFNFMFLGYGVDTQKYCYHWRIRSCEADLWNSVTLKTCTIWIINQNNF